MQLSRPLPVHPYRLFPIADQIAEKVTATMGTYAGRPSSRVKDLVDLVTIAHTQTPNLRELQIAIEMKRRLSDLDPFAEFSAPSEWERIYRALALRTPAAGDVLDLTDATRLAKKLIDPALVEERVDVTLNWIPRDEEWARADAR